MTSYFIWSNEHRGWWRPGNFGYTTAAHKAARFSKGDAERIVAEANKIIPDQEIMVIAPDPAIIQLDLLEEC